MQLSFSLINAKWSSGTGCGLLYCPTSKCLHRPCLQMVLWMELDGCCCCCCSHLTLSNIVIGPKHIQGQRDAKASARLIVSYRAHTRASVNVLCLVICEWAELLIEIDQGLLSWFAWKLLDNVTHNVSTVEIIIQKTCEHLCKYKRNDMLTTNCPSTLNGIKFAGYERWREAPILLYLTAAVLKRLCTVASMRHCSFGLISSKQLWNSCTMPIVLVTYTVDQ